MISYLKGEVKSIDQSVITLLVGGVGYCVNVPSSNTILEGSEVELYVFLNVKQEELSLWGFVTHDELSFFKLLISVSGVGPRTAMNLISNKGVANIANSVISDDYKGLKVSGLGDKTAQKIVIDLKGKISEHEFGAASNTIGQSESDKKIYNETLDALESLGYRRYDIENTLKEILKEKDTKFNTSQELIKAALKSL